MKLIGYFSLLMFFIISILSFAFMYVNDRETSYISSSRFLDLVEDFPRENFQKMLDSWDYFTDNVSFQTWRDDKGTLENIVDTIWSLIRGIGVMIKSVFMFFIAFSGYGFDLVVWFLSLPYHLIL